MGSYSFRLNGVEVEAHPAGVLWWPDRRLMAVADMHLEKGSAYAPGGIFLPPYDSMATLARLGQAVASLEPARVVALGDSFHDPTAEARLHPKALDALSGLVNCCEWIWLRGNHDPAPDPGLGGEVHQEWYEEPLVFRHEPSVRTAGEVAGHLHPKLRISSRGRSVSARCFVTDGAQVVMPAFGELTGGLSARSADVRRVFGRPQLALLVGPRRVHPVRI
jgi:uncharacterized protein